MNVGKQLFVVKLLICLINLQFCDAFLRFSRGRRFNGNLGEPSKYSPLEETPSPDLYFDQELDHFDPFSNVTWKQRYFLNNDYHKKGGPVFLMIGGEGEASAKWMKQGAWIHYAREHNALCFQLEHRYYGKSHPTASLSVGNLLYLSSEQALADLANFVRAMNIEHHATLGDSPKWIAFGGSYPGSLAAWVREKYPHFIHGAISTSGPLLAKADFVEYFQVVENSLRTYSDDCVTAVQMAFSQVDIMMRHMIGQRALTEKFTLCSPLEESVNNAPDVANLYSNLADIFAGVVQYNKDNRPNAPATIDDLCDVMVNQTIGPPVNRLAVINSMMLKKEKLSCSDFSYAGAVKNMSQTSWKSETAEGGRQWTYQTCTEFGFYQTAEDSSSIFTDKMPLNFFVKQCTDVFGPRFNADVLTTAVSRTNIKYGALKPGTTNVLFVHGSIDPWHALGLTNSTDPHLPTLYIEGTAHCANMYEPSDNDLPQLKQARITINQYIKDLIE